jgi:hypothetical protein
VTADLGALGAKEGPAIPHDWSPPSRMPRFLPVLALLLLLLPQRNRCRQALWVSVPLVVELALAPLVMVLTDMGAEGDGGNLGILNGMTFGLAAVWLLSPYLKGRTRRRTFLRFLAVMEAFALLSFVCGRYGGRSGGPVEMVIGVALFALLCSVVLSLAGWSCRERPGWGRLLLWLIVWIVGGLLALFVVMSVSWGVGSFLEMATAFLVMAAITFGLLLPFLLLSFTNAFYRQRLKELLCLPDAAPAAGG